MKNQSIVKTKTLKPLKIWLSGAIPENEYWNHSLVDRDILEFVSFFSSLIFQKGGQIVHGSHPLFTPILVEQAKRFAHNKNQLQLCVSSMWGRADIEKYSKHASILEVDSYQGSKNFDDPHLRNKSLSLLRNEMAHRSNCIVSIGGKLHPGTQISPGVTEEIEIAKYFNLPCYVLGGYGGASSEVQISSNDNKFLSKEEVTYLMENREVSFLPSRIVGLLSRDSKKIAFNNFIRKVLKSFKSF